MKRSLILTLAAAVILAGAGCKSPAEMNAVFAKAKSLQTSPDYLIGEGDEMTIRVLGERELVIEEQLVRPDGKISFPNHGDVQVAGKTVEQLRLELQEIFKTSMGLTAPTVHVMVNTFSSKSVTVLGEVNVEGRFPYTGQMRVTDLLGLTRGLKITSAPNRTLLFREVDGNTKVYHVFLKDFLQKADFSTNFFVQPGDIVFIPKNGFSLAAEKITVFVSPLDAALSFLSFGATTTTYFVP